MSILIFWNHVGREHGGLDYTEDIRKNDADTISWALELKEKRARESSSRFIKFDKNTLIELPPLGSERKYIIVYCIDRGLQFSLNYKSRYPWWLIDIVDIQEVKPNVFCVHDLLIDLSVNLDRSYNVLDMDEYGNALTSGAMTEDQVKSSLNSFNSILEELNTKQFPNSLLVSITRQYFSTDEMDGAF
jgi:hypothetical protein